MRILDLFCGAGGAAMGYRQAWPDAEIVGVDIEEQPDYPFEFVLGDALGVLSDYVTAGAWVDGAPFDLIHASPPCQAYSTATPSDNEWPDLVGPVRDLLSETGVPWVIENVPGAPVAASLVLCGSMFGLEIQRHRAFELSPGLPLILSPAHDHRSWEHGRPWTVTGHFGGGQLAHSMKPRNVEHAAELMGMQWVTSVRGLTEAIPPAYTRFIAEQIGEQI